MKAIFVTIVLVSLVVQTNGQSYTFDWATQTGWLGAEVGNSIAIDDSGNVYTTGYYNGTVDFDPGPGVFNLPATGGWEDIFIQKLDSNGNFVWAKGIGRTESCQGRGIVVDNAGSVYITGYFQDSVDFDPGAGISSLISNPRWNSNAFILKLDSYGNLVWIKSLGEDWAQSFSICTDANSNLLITGTFDGTVDFDPGPATFYLNAVGGANDIFISKLDSAGNFLWAKSMGGASWNSGDFICTDHYGNIYTTGSYSGTVDFDQGPGTYNLTSHGLFDIFILKLDPMGNFLWANSMGGPGNDDGRGLTIDTFGNIYSTGDFCQTADFDSGPGIAQLTALGGGQFDIYISKIDSNGNFIWAKGLGGYSDDVGYAIIAEPNGYLYITGFFTDTVDFDPGIGIYNIGSSGATNVFISSFDLSGNFIWVKSFGGIFGAEAFSIALDNSNNIYSTGYFTDTVDFNPGSGVFNLEAVGSLDIFVHKMRPCYLDATTTLSGINISADLAGATYQWIDCNSGLPISGDTNQIFTPTVNGDYAVIVSSEDCSDTSICTTFNSIGIMENSVENSVLIYPNPSNGNFIVESQSSIKIIVTDAFGRIVLKEDIKDKKQNLNIQHCANGIYFAKLLSNGKVQTIKLIKSD